MSTIALTGGTGFLGRELCKQALEKKHHIKILTSCPIKSLSESQIQYFQGDITKKDKNTEKILEDFLEGADILYHLAGKVSRKTTDNPHLMKIHIEGTRQILDVAKKKNIQKIVLLSSSGVSGISHTPKEADDESPYAMKIALKWPYYASKIFQEKLAIQKCKEYNLQLLIFRPSLFLGPGDTNFSSTLDIKKFLEKKIPAVPRGGVSFVDVRDVATLALEKVEIAFSKIPRGQYRSYLLAGSNMSFDEFLKNLENLSGHRQARLNPSRKTQIRSAQIADTLNFNAVSVEMANYYWYINSNRAKEELLWSPRDPVQETLKDTIDFIRTISNNAL